MSGMLAFNNLFALHYGIYSSLLCYFPCRDRTSSSSLHQRSLLVFGNAQLEYQKRLELLVYQEQCQLFCQLQVSLQHNSSYRLEYKLHQPDLFLQTCFFIYNCCFIYRLFYVWRQTLPSCKSSCSLAFQLQTHLDQFLRQMGYQQPSLRQLLCVLKVCQVVWL